ncbi:deoxyribodipyrimidine photo-lyase [Maricaulis sp.]|uniref:cryptochrome/photolyase family protein n=1 Tax=Maricaulis sp. TaxID=1486257 RepID=UPI002608B1A4|nr:deoxyribodipyrimidine photo-lyase [Maricaulis sp.]
MATPPATAPALVWFRRDLRLADNPALYAAVQSGRPLICVYIREADPAFQLSPGAAADWWLHHSLAALSQALDVRGGHLTLLSGRSESLIPELVRRHGIAEVFWNRVDWPWMDARDRRIADMLKSNGARARAFRIATLIDPPALLNGSGTPYKVFSAFWRAALKDLDPRTPLPAPDRLAASPETAGDTLDDWCLTPRNPDWAVRFPDRWAPGEAGAHKRLERFLADSLSDYRNHRDRPDRFGTSRLSPHLGWGEISARTVWHRVQLHAERGGHFQDADKFLAEIGWRDFAYYLGHHFGDLRHTNFNRDFDRFPWRDDPEALAAWTTGRTGVPMVDAAMRELWATGWMHNRVRMIVASYLVKHIGCHWREGMAWFEDTLVDADPLVNAASWQWVAGSGADAAPYFRIFNPAAQGKKFDPEGHYVRRWVPEVNGLAPRDIHAPWAAPAGELAMAGIQLGTSYPRPVADLKTGRERALEAYRTMKAETVPD